MSPSSASKPLVHVSLESKLVVCMGFVCRSPPRASTGWRRVIGCLIFIGHFPQKSPIIGG